LFKLAQGGDQPVEPNLRLLRDLAERQLKEGNSQGAIRCLEAALQLRDDGAVRERLRELYRRHRLAAFERGHPSVLPVIGVMLGAAVIGVTIGILDHVSAVGFSTLFGEEMWTILAILSWTPLVAMAFIGGLILRQLIVWALIHARSRQMALGVSLAAVAASLALYGLPEGTAIGQYVAMLLSGTTFLSTSDAILASGAVLTRGGVFAVLDAIKTGGLSGVIYTLILLACAAYYFTISVSAASSTTQWQQSLAIIGDEVATLAGRAFHPGWIAIASVVLGLALFTSLFLQQELVSADAAISHNDHALELMEQGKPEEAIIEFKKAIRLRPDSAVAHSNLGWAYYYQGELDEAIAEYQEAIRIDPSLAYAYDGLGWAYYFWGEPDMAFQVLREAIRLDPSLAEAHHGLGRIYYDRGELDKAVEEARSRFRKALGLAAAVELMEMEYDWGGTTADQGFEQLWDRTSRGLMSRIFTKRLRLPGSRPTGLEDEEASVQEALFIELRNRVKNDPWRTFQDGLDGRLGNSLAMAVMHDLIDEIRSLGAQKHGAQRTVSLDRIMFDEATDHGSAEPVSIPSDPLRPTQLDPADEVANADTFEWALSFLSLEEQRVVRLRSERGLTQPEIAKQLRISQPSVSRAIKRAKQKLRTKLDSRDF